MERFRIVKIETCGMKGISKPISIEFENQTLSGAVFNNQSIKAIYGANGSGKTSIITSIDVYKNVCFDSSYLYSYSAILKKLINKKTHRFAFTVYFVGESKKAFYHSIVINAASEKPFIESESIGVITGRTINEGKKEIIRIENGKLVSYSETNKDGQERYDSVVKDAINRLSEYRSIITLFTDRIFYVNTTSIKGELMSNVVLNTLLRTYQFINDVVVYLSASDIHNEISWDSFVESVVDKQSGHNEKNEPNKLLFVSSSTLVPKKLFKWYENQIQRTAKFIKLFKEELEDIKIIKISQGDSYQCRLEMTYADYTVDYEYESAGIKNLIGMFICLEHSSRGGIVFIDEMDVNINEIYLERLFNYFMKYGKGQLCVTIHNTAPMKVLKSGKHSIDFISSSHGVVSWIKNGAKNPTVDFKDGMIPGMPFNVNDFDFTEVFEEN